MLDAERHLTLNTTVLHYILPISGDLNDCGVSWNLDEYGENKLNDRLATNALCKDSTERKSTVQSRSCCSHRQTEYHANSRDVFDKPLGREE